MRQQEEAATDDSKNLISLDAQKRRRWKTKAALAAGVGVPLGLIAMSNPAAASPAGDYASDDFESADTEEEKPEEAPDEVEDTDAGGEPEEAETLDDSGATVSNASTQAEPVQEEPKETVNEPSPEEPGQVTISEVETNQSPTTTENDFRDLTADRGDFNQPSLDQGGTRHDVPLSDGQNGENGVVINATDGDDVVSVKNLRHTDKVPEVDEGLRKHLNVVEVNGTDHYVSNRKELRVNLHDGDDTYKTKNKEGVRDNATTHVSGGDGDDKMTGGRGNENMHGGDGNDDMNGHYGDDNMWGGDGDDKMRGSRGNDNMWGGDGDDDMHGGENHLRYVFSGLSDNDNMWGGAGDDKMRGGQDADRMDGGAGNDDMGGNGGNDIMYGRYGDDKMRGGDGNDEMYGGHGTDDMHGGEGNDKMYGDTGVGSRRHQEALYRLVGGKKNFQDPKEQQRLTSYLNKLRSKAVNGEKMSRTQRADWQMIAPLLSEQGHGDDKMNGGGGSDDLFGEGGDDNIKDHSIATRDRIAGGSGNDIISAKYGPKEVLAGAGDDTVYTSARRLAWKKVDGEWKKGVYATKVDTGPGADTVHLSWRAPAKVVDASQEDIIHRGPSWSTSTKADDSAELTAQQYLTAKVQLEKYHPHKGQLSADLDQMFARLSRKEAAKVLRIENAGADVAQANLAKQKKAEADKLAKQKKAEADKLTKPKKAEAAKAKQPKTNIRTKNGNLVLGKQ